MFTPDQKLPVNLCVTSRLVLGTAQLGMSYGIANKIGKPDVESARAIVETAWNAGICEYDTAQAYGDSEKVLGAVLSELKISDRVKVISKLDPKMDHRNDKNIFESVEMSMNRLGISRLHGILLHNEDHVNFLESGLEDTLERLLSTGIVEKIGVSVYSPEKAMRALSSDVVDMVQVPANIFDQRFEKAGVFACAAAKGKRVYVRSVFLQGLLLMKPEEIPESMNRARKSVDIISRMSDELGVSRQEMALGYVKLKYPSARVLFGAETSEQVKENCISWAKEMPESFLTKAEAAFGDIDEEIISPNLWHRES